MDKIELLRLIRGWLHRHDKDSSLEAAKAAVQMMEEIGLICFYNRQLRPTDMLQDGGVPNDFEDMGKGWRPG